MTMLTAFGSSKRKKPNPREVPVLGSFMMLQSTTFPNCEKYCFNPSVAA